MNNVLVAKRKAARKRKMRSAVFRRLSILAVLILGVFTVKMIGQTGETDFLIPKSNVVQDLNDEIVRGEIPSFFQSDKRWKDHKYGDGTMEFTGCGQTCLAMVLCGLNQTTKYDPVTVAEFAERLGYYADGSGSCWTLMSEGAEKLGLNAGEVIFDETHIKRELQNGRPIISVMGPGDFTTTGHYIVLCGIDSQNMVTIRDPNSRERSERKWRLDELMPQIKNLWSYHL